MDKNKKWIIIVLGIIGILLLIVCISLINRGEKITTDNVVDEIKDILGGGSNGNVADNGVSIQVNLVDENGRLEQNLLGPDDKTFSILSAANPHGFVQLSNASCNSSLLSCTKTSDCSLGQVCISSQCKCSFISFDIFFDNSAGNSNITINTVSANVVCSANNSDPGCASIPNVFGLSSVAGTKRGNMNSKFNLPLTIGRYSGSNIYTSDPITLDEVASILSDGQIDFKIIANGTYKDSSGIDQPFSIPKIGTKSFRVAKSTCLDGTPVDYSVSDSDTNTFCAVAAKGKYCKVNTLTGYPTYTDRANLCGCPTGLDAVGEVCQSTATCSANNCISGSINYCGADGKTVQPKCTICGYTNCPKNYYNEDATGCSGDNCAYPPHSDGMSISFGNDTIPIVNPCGDGVKNGDEQCDSFDFGGATCTSLGYSSGTLACSSCLYTTASCTTNVSTPSTSYCYQESATVANQVGTDGNCGLQYTGNYYSYLSSSYDLPNYFYINYTKPAGYTSAIWKIKHGTLATYNVTIPSSCFSQNKLQLRFYNLHNLFSNIYSSYGQCFDGANWVNITSISYGTNAGNYAGTASGNNGYFDSWYDGEYISNCFYSILVNQYGSCVSNDCPAVIYEEGIYWSIT